MYQGQIGLKVKIPQSGWVLEHIVYSLLLPCLSYWQGDSASLSICSLQDYLTET